MLLFLQCDPVDPKFSEKELRFFVKKICFDDLKDIEDVPIPSPNPKYYKLGSFCQISGFFPEILQVIDPVPESTFFRLVA